jgi:hypothetical protein
LLFNDVSGAPAKTSRGAVIGANNADKLQEFLAVDLGQWLTLSTKTSSVAINNRDPQYLRLLSTTLPQLDILLKRAAVVALSNGPAVWWGSPPAWLQIITNPKPSTRGFIPAVVRGGTGGGGPAPPDPGNTGAQNGGTGNTSGQNATTQNDKDPDNSGTPSQNTQPTPSLQPDNPTHVVVNPTPQQVTRPLVDPDQARTPPTMILGPGIVLQDGGGTDPDGGGTRGFW